jgi:hypothetical protein
MKPLPSALEVERDLLNTALTIPDSTETIFSSLSPDDFYSTSHKILFQILADMHRQSKPFDISIIRNGLRPDQKKHLTSSVFDAVLSGPPCVSVEHSAGTLKEMSCRRRAIELSHAIAKAADDPHRPLADLAELAARITVTDSQPSGLRVINADDWLTTEPPKPDQVLEDMLDAGDKMVLIASSKQRKSFFFQQLALSLAAGHDFLGWHVRTLQMPSGLHRPLQRYPRPDPDNRRRSRTDLAEFEDPPADQQGQIDHLRDGAQRIDRPDPAARCHAEAGQAAARQVYRPAFPLRTGCKVRDHGRQLPGDRFPAAETVR